MTARETRRRGPFNVATRCMSVQSVANGSGGVLPINSAVVIPFSSLNRRRDIASSEIPNHCGNGYALTPDNIRIDQRERRWRCRQCGRERAGAFRARQKRAV